MKRSILLLLSLLLVAVLIVSEPQPVTAQVNLSALKAQIDGELALLWDIILTRQLAHYSMYGKWFQGMITHGTIPADGNVAFPDNWGSSPTDQNTNWQDFLDTRLPATLPMAITIDVYTGPLGSGFTACVWAYANGDLYRRCKAIGPEKQPRTLDWHIYP